MKIQGVCKQGLVGASETEGDRRRCAAGMWLKDMSYSYGGMHFSCDSRVCEKNTPPEKKTCGKSSFQSTKSGAGEQFLPLDCFAKARAKGFFFTDTGIVVYDNVGCKYGQRNTQTKAWQALDPRSPWNSKHKKQTVCVLLDTDRINQHTKIN